MYNITFLFLSYFSLKNIEYKKKKKEKTPWPESANELYRPCDRRLSTKVVPTFEDRVMSRSRRGGSSTSVISVF
jgi:hypothetical protein